MEKRCIGILGGISHESTAAYYLRIHQLYFAQVGDYAFPEVVIYSLDFQRFTDYENRGDVAAYVDYIGEGLDALGRAGADFALMAANSPHSHFDAIAQAAPMPLLSITDVTAAAAVADEAQRLLLLGIGYTMRGDFYARAMAQVGIDVVTPSEADQALVDGLIFDELAQGRFTDHNRTLLGDVIERTHASTPVDGVILGCTELPLLMQQAHSRLRLYDTLELHCAAALEWALAPVLPHARGEDA